ncbi:MAG: hypothetical protein ACE5EC_01820 [Phycisphaerae bacterium]
MSTTDLIASKSLLLAATISELLRASATMAVTRNFLAFYAFAFK